MGSQEKIQELIQALLLELGEDVHREGLKDTPKRVAKSFEAMLSGHSRSLANEMTVFENTHGYDDMIYAGGINFFSTCEHHLLPFYGKAHIAYIPGSKIVGLSKFARAVDIYARRLQDQERITMQVADALTELLDAKGLAVILEGQHFCNMSRGVNQPESVMKTSTFRGVFKDNENLRDRFLAMTNK